MRHLTIFVILHIRSSFVIIVRNVSTIYYCIGFDNVRSCCLCKQFDTCFIKYILKENDLVFIGFPFVKKWLLLPLSPSQLFYPYSEDNDKEMGAITEEEAEKKASQIDGYGYPYFHRKLTAFARNIWHNNTVRLCALNGPYRLAWEN